jgi:hypothetical protein
MDERKNKTLVQLHNISISLLLRSISQEVYNSRVIQSEHVSMKLAKIIYYVCPTETIFKFHQYLYLFVQDHVLTVVPF